MKLNRHERRAIATIARKRGKALRAVSGLSTPALRDEHADEMASARRERSKKLRALGFLGLLLMIFTAFACAAPRLAPAHGVAFEACRRSGQSSMFCACFEHALPPGVENPSQDQAIDAMESCADAPREPHGFRPLKDLFRSDRPLGPQTLAAR